MTDGFDIKELTKFQKELLNIANVKMPKESKAFLRKEGLKLKKVTLKSAKTSIKKDTGDFFKSIKRGKVYKYKENGALSVRVYSSAPQAHLIEYGHRQVLNPGKGEGNGKGVKPGKGIGKQIGFVKGKRIFEKSQKEFDSEFYNDTQHFIEEVLDKGLS